MSSNLIKTIVKRSRPRWPFQCHSTVWLPTLTLCLLGSLLTTQGQDPYLSNPTYPKDANVSLGATVSFRVYANSTNLPMTYQWQHAGTNLPAATNNPLVLTNVTVADAGGYQATVWNASGDSINSRTAILTVDPTFTQVTAGHLTTDMVGAWNASWIDYDGDGYLDVSVAPGGSLTRTPLYHNEGDGTFRKVTTNAIATTSVRSYSHVWGDYDNDGKPDLFVPNYQGMNDMLFHNDGNGAFTRITTGHPVSDGAYSPLGVWSDYDRDGFIDLFVITEGTCPDQNDLLYRNSRDGTFQKMTEAQVGPLVADLTSSDFAVWADVDNDGWPELCRNITTACRSASYTNEIWHVNAEGKFYLMDIGDLKKGTEAYTAPCWADYNNDGFLDAVVWAERGLLGLYLNLAGQGFTNVAASAFPSPLTNCSGTWVGDYDNDGWLDLDIGFWTSQPTAPALFRNNGDGTFTRQYVGGPTSALGWHVWGDYNNDGFLDILMPYGPNTRNSLFRHNGNTNHWLKVKLDGRASNRSGIGAKVRVNATIAGRTFWQMREISGQGLGADNGLLAHFGLGDATQVTTLRIEWPSGIVQRLYNVPAGQFLTVIETTNTPPVAQITVSPLAAFPGVTEKVVIAPNGTSAVVVLDGSLSSDVDNDPLQYWWIEGATPIATGMIATQVLGIGSHPITLVVSDGVATGTNSVTVEVVTPAQSVGILMEMVDDSALSRMRQRPLLATLNAAAAALGRGDVIAGVNQLHAFQNKVWAQVEPRDPALAEALVQSAQVIIQAVGSGLRPQVKVPVQEASRLTSE